MALKKNKDLKYYFSLPWNYTVKADKDNAGKKIYVISVNELSGIQTDAYTKEEAFKLIKEAMEAMFELYMEMGKEIPEPIDIKSCNT